MTSYCSNCIHYKVCGNEGVDDVAMTFCADKQTDGDLISRQTLIDYVKSKDNDGYFENETKKVIKIIESMPSAESEEEE